MSRECKSNCGVVEHLISAQFIIRPQPMSLKNIDFFSKKNKAFRFENSHKPCGIASIPAISGNPSFQQGLDLEFLSRLSLVACPFLGRKHMLENRPSPGFIFRGWSLPRLDLFDDDNPRPKKWSNRLPGIGDKGLLPNCSSTIHENLN